MKNNRASRGYWNSRISTPTIDSYAVPRFIKSAITELGDIKGKTVLDCGIGVGMTTAILSRETKVYGFDCSEKSIEIAKATVKSYGNPDNTILQVADFQSLPYPNDFFDMALGIHVLHHLEDLQVAGSELYRVLKTPGKAIFVENWQHSLIRRLIRPLFINIADLAALATPNETALSYSDIRKFCQYFQEYDIRVPHDIFCMWKLVMLLSNIGIVYDICRIPQLMRVLDNVLCTLDSVTYYACPPLRSQSYYTQVVVRKESSNGNFS